MLILDFPCASLVWRLFDGDRAEDFDWIDLPIFFSSVSLNYSFLMTCGAWIWRGPGKILSRKDLHLKYSGIRT